MINNNIWRQWNVKHTKCFAGQGGHGRLWGSNQGWVLFLGPYICGMGQEVDFKPCSFWLKKVISFLPHVTFFLMIHLDHSHGINCDFIVTDSVSLCWIPGFGALSKLCKLVQVISASCIQYRNKMIIWLKDCLTPNWIEIKKHLFSSIPGSSDILKKYWLLPVLFWELSPSLV